MLRGLHVDTLDFLLELAGGRVDTEAAGACVVPEGDVEASGAEGEAGGFCRLLERDVDATDARERAGLLHVRERRHHPVVGLHGEVPRALAGEIEVRDALLLAERVGRERGAIAVYDEGVVVAEVGRGEVSNVAHLEGAALEAHPYAGAEHVARGPFARAAEEEHTATEQGVYDRAAARLPAKIFGTDDLAARAGENVRDSGGGRLGGARPRERREETEHRERHEDVALQTKPFRALVARRAHLAPY